MLVDARLGRQLAFSALVVRLAQLGGRLRHRTTAPSVEAIVARLEEIVHPVPLQPVRYFYDLGLRERVLTLPTMVGFVRGMLWRQVGSVSEMTRQIHQELVLWALAAVRPIMHARWHARQRPLPPKVAWAHANFHRFLIADGSTVDALLRQLKPLADGTQVSLGGRALALLDRATRLPVRAWFESNPTAYDMHLAGSWQREQSAQVQPGRQVTPISRPARPLPRLASGSCHLGLGQVQALAIHY
jgi:hypothetical protein